MKQVMVSNASYSHIDQMPVARAVEIIIDSAPDYYDGDLESMKRKIDVMARIIDQIVEAMPPDQALHVLNSVSSGWEAVPDERV